MLPYVKPKHFGMSGPVDSLTMSDSSEPEEKEHSEGIMSAAGDLIKAVHARDVKGVADALKFHHEMKMSEDFLSEDDEGME